MINIYLSYKNILALINLLLKYTTLRIENKQVLITFKSLLLRHLPKHFNKVPAEIDGGQQLLVSECITPQYEHIYCVCSF